MKRTCLNDSAKIGTALSSTVNEIWSRPLDEHCWHNESQRASRFADGLEIVDLVSYAFNFRLKPPSSDGRRGFVIFIYREEKSVFGKQPYSWLAYSVKELFENNIIWIKVWCVVNWVTTSNLYKIIMKQVFVFIHAGSTLLARKMGDNPFNTAGGSANDTNSIPAIHDAFPGETRPTPQAPARPRSLPHCTKTKTKQLITWFCVRSLRHSPRRSSSSTARSRIPISA